MNIKKYLERYSEVEKIETAVDISIIQPITAKILSDMLLEVMTTSTSPKAVLRMNTKFNALNKLLKKKYGVVIYKKDCFLDYVDHILAKTKKENLH
jgi:hypothetical protein